MHALSPLAAAAVGAVVLVLVARRQKSRDDYAHRLSVDGARIVVLTLSGNAATPRTHIVASKRFGRRRTCFDPTAFYDYFVFDDDEPLRFDFEWADGVRATLRAPSPDGVPRTLRPGVVATVTPIARRPVWRVLADLSPRALPSGAVLHVDRTPHAGPWLLFVCGRGLPLVDRRLLEEARARGRRLAVLYYRTHGPARPADVASVLDSCLVGETLDEAVNDALEALRVLGRDVDLVSYSLGGLIATLCLVRHRVRVRSHVAFSPFLSFSHMSFVDPATPVGLGLLHLARPWLPSQHGRRVIERGQDRTYDSVRQLVHDVAYPTQPPLQTPCRLAVTLNFVVATARAIAELKAAPRGAVAVPTLVIISSNDNVIDAPTCARRAERLCGGECTVVDVPAAGHNVYSLESEARLSALYDVLGAFWDGEAVHPHAGRLGRVVQDRRAKTHT